jgi:enhancer of polycomb-like protein
MQITAQVENEMAQMKDKDKGDWEDGLDNPYQTRPVPYGDRLFKYATSSAPRTTSSGMDSRQVRGARALRLRVGRGGRLHLDRRQHPLISPDIDTRRLLTMGDSEHSDDSEATALDSLDYLEEDRRRLEERWKFDEDDSPPVGSIGVEEQDRVLFDDYQAKLVFSPLFAINF